MSVSYELFLPEVLPFVRDCPEVVAVNAIRNATIEFCEETRYLQENLDPMGLIANEGYYDLETDDTNYRVIDIIEAWNAEQFLVPKSIEELTRIYRMTDWQNLKGNPYYYFRTRSQEMRIVPTPEVSKPNALKVRVAVAPKRTSTVVDDEIHERFVEQISYGARARLYDTANQPYYDPKAALEYRKRFNDVIADVRTRVNKGLSRASVQIEFQRVV